MRVFVTTQHIKAGWQEMSARSADIVDLFLLAQRFLPAVVTSSPLIVGFSTDVKLTVSLLRLIVLLSLLGNVISTSWQDFL